MASNAPTYSGKILAALAVGDMTARDLTRETGIDIRYVTPKVSTLLKAGKIHLVGYRRDSDGGRLYPRAVYSLEPSPVPVKKPKKLSATEYGRRYRERCRTAVSSIWELGKTVNKRRAAFDWRKV